MSPRSITLAPLVLFAAAGCGSGLLLPVPAEEVTVTLAVSGGIAGVSYSIVVDGAAGEVRGGACDSFCDWEPGDLLLPISAEQVRALSARLDESGVLDLDGEDLGDTCCDIFHIELVYERGSRIARVEGTEDRFPPALASAVQTLMGFAQKRAAMLVAPNTDRSEWPRDPYILGEVRVDGLVLEAELSYGGGCADHRLDLVGLGGWLESHLVQMEALITHDDGDDGCDALVIDERRFDLRPLRASYIAAYGPIGATRPRVILRLWDPTSASPVGRLVEVEL